MHEENIAVWGIGSIWLAMSVALIAYTFRKGRKRRNRSFHYAFCFSHMFAPAAIGGYGWGLVIPATYSIYGNIVAVFTKELFFFRRQEAINWIFFALVCWLLTFLLLWGLIALVRHLILEPGTVVNASAATVKSENHLHD
jgi:hypothetical protein